MDEGVGGGFHDDEEWSKDGRHGGVGRVGQNGKAKVMLDRNKKSEEGEKEMNAN